MRALRFVTLALGLAVSASLPLMFACTPRPGPEAAPGAPPAEPSRAPDVPYEPSSAASIEAMLLLAAPGPGDVVYDLGCGDGRVVIEAVRRSGARGVCVDIDPARIHEARRNAERAGLSDRMTFRTEDLFETDIRDASVILLFLWPEVNLRLLPKLLGDLQPGTRIVSNMHDMGSFAAERALPVTSPTTGRSHEVFLWRVPARAESSDSAP